MNEIKDQSFISRFEFSVCCSSGRLYPLLGEAFHQRRKRALRELFWYINFPNRTGVASRLQLDVCAELFMIGGGVRSFLHRRRRRQAVNKERSSDFHINSTKHTSILANLEVNDGGVSSVKL